jgi:hypothetical protein
MERDGLYARLYSMQFRDPEEEVAGLRARPRDTQPEERSQPEQRVGLLGVLRGSA